MPFTLDDDLRRLDWRQPGGQKSNLTESQAMVIAVASIADALDNIALQLHQALDPLQEIADYVRHTRYMRKD